MACLLGHKWDGCVCSKCGNTRDEEHDWDLCAGKCRKCGKECEPQHHWNEGGVCSKCNAKFNFVVSDNCPQDTLNYVAEFNKTSPVPKSSDLYEKLKSNQGLDYSEAALLYLIIFQEGNRRSLHDPQQGFMWQFSIGANMNARIKNYFDKTEDDILAIYRSMVQNCNTDDAVDTATESPFDATVNGALKKLEECFKSQDKDEIIAIGKELYEANKSMLIMHTVAERFAQKFPRDAGTLNYLWNGIGNWQA